MVKYIKEKNKKNYKNKMKGKCLLLLHFVGSCVFRGKILFSSK